MESLIPLALLFGVMYFVLIRPQKQRVKAQQALVRSLAVGDQVLTIGGIFGEIIALDDETAQVETTPGTILRCRRNAIAGVVGPPLGATPAETDAEEGP
jgi:preprotein translocase subunit YajC